MGFCRNFRDLSHKSREHDIIFHQLLLKQKNIFLLNLFRKNMLFAGDCRRCSHSLPHQRTGYAFSLAENVSLCPEEKTDKVRAERCLRDAGLGNKLGEWEKGVDTPILKVLHNDGINPSGGEKQKIALARALYKDAPVVILDEPTAALDALAESKLYEEFDALVQGRTSVYISHRLASTRFCDVIALFEGGDIIEYGTHEGLLRILHG